MSKLIYDPDLLDSLMLQKIDDKGYILSEELKIAFESKYPAVSAAIFLKVNHKYFGLTQFFSRHHRSFVYAVSEEDIPPEFLKSNVKLRMVPLPTR
jgi:hypothetical protein